MTKKDWLNTLKWLQQKIDDLKKQSEEKTNTILHLYILVLLIENFLQQQKISELKNNDALTFIDFANYTKTMSLSTFFSNGTFDEEQKEIVLDLLSNCLKYIEEIRQKKLPPPRLPKSKSEPCFFAPQKTYYLLNAKSVVTILMKSDAAELMRIFEQEENIVKILRTSDDLIPALRNLLPIGQQIIIYRKLYDANFFSHRLTYLQNFIGKLHAIEFSKLNLNNQRCRYYYRFMLLTDNILENRHIPIATRKMIAACILKALIKTSELKAEVFQTLPSLLALKKPF